MVKQSPKLFTHVLRALGSIRDTKGASEPAVVNQIKETFNENGSDIPNNFTMQVRRALKHGLDNGMVSLRAGKYRMTAKKRLIPVDSLEIDSRRKSRRRSRRSRRRRRSPRRRRHSSDHDFTEHKSRRSRRRRRSRRKRRRSPQSRTGTPSTAAEQPRTATSSPSVTAKQSKSDINKEENVETSHQEADSSRRRRRRRRRRCSPPRRRNSGDGPPTVEDDAMDQNEEGAQRTLTPRKSSQPPKLDTINEPADGPRDHQPPFYN